MLPRLHSLAALVNNKSPVIVEEAPPPSSHRSHGRWMFGDSLIDFKGPPRAYDGTTVHIKKSSKTKSVRYIEVSDGSSPIAVKDVKPPCASSSKAEPLEIQSDIVNISSSSEASEELHDGGDVLKKWKAKTSSKPAAKKRMKYVEDKKGKAVFQEVVESSDEELISGKILTGLSWSFI